MFSLLQELAPVILELFLALDLQLFFLEEMLLLLLFGYMVVLLFLDRLRGGLVWGGFRRLCILILWLLFHIILTFSKGI